MSDTGNFPWGLDYSAFGLYLWFSASLLVGRRKEKNRSEDILRGGAFRVRDRTSYVAANISTEHFIGMVAAAYVYGICIAIGNGQHHGLQHPDLVFIRSC